MEPWRILEKPALTTSFSRSPDGSLLTRVDGKQDLPLSATGSITRAVNVNDIRFQLSHGIVAQLVFQYFPIAHCE